RGRNRGETANRQRVRLGASGRRGGGVLVPADPGGGLPAQAAERLPWGACVGLLRRLRRPTVPPTEVPDPPAAGHEPGVAEQPVRRRTPLDYRPVRDAPAGDRRGGRSARAEGAIPGAARAVRGPLLRWPGGPVILV